MGWTYVPARHRRDGRIDRKAELDDLFTWKDGDGSSEILKSAMVGTTYYAACRRTRPDGGSEVYALTALTDAVEEEGRLGYKDMTEDEGPYACACPAGILGLLSPTDDPTALRWREECREERARLSRKRSLSALPTGTVIEVELRGRRERLRKMPPSHQFRTPFWMFTDRNAYLPKKRIPADWTVVG